MPKQPRLPRLLSGVAAIDKWIDTIVSALERALNITTAGGIAAKVGPSGTHLYLDLPVGLYLAQAVSSGGIPARASGVPGKGAVNVYSFDGAAAPVSLYSDPDCFNLNGSAVGVSGKWLVIGRVQNRWWFIITEVCT